MEVFSIQRVKIVALKLWLTNQTFLTL